MIILVDVGGRPLKYTVDELHGIITKYFAVTPLDEWTVTGLALLVGCKQTWYEYGMRPDYKAMIKEATLKVENSYELSLRKNGNAGNIFALKNFGWTDKSEIESTHVVTQMPAVKIGGDEMIFDIGTDETKEIEDHDR